MPTLSKSHYHAKNYTGGLCLRTLPYESFSFKSSCSQFHLFRIRSSFLTDFFISSCVLTYSYLVGVAPERTSLAAVASTARDITSERLRSSTSREKDPLTNSHDDVDSSDFETDYDPILDSDTASIASTAFSVATTAVGPDAVEAIFHRMIDFGTLRYLWSQLVARHNGSRKRCLLTIGRLLKSYSEDLGRLATAAQLEEDQGIICLSACRFVRKSRFDLAQRIWRPMITARNQPKATLMRATIFPSICQVLRLKRM